MSSWQFDPQSLSIKNVKHGTWAIDLRKLSGKEDLLQWLLQAAKHNFNMNELFDEFRIAIEFCFGIDGINGAQMLQDLYEARNLNVGPVDWATGTIKQK